MWIAALLLVSVGSGRQPPPVQQGAPLASVSTRDGLTRQGVHHAGVRGRLVDPAGRPVSGARVLLWTRATGATRGAFDLGHVTTDPAGVFAFEDVSTPYAPGITVSPPPRLRQATRALDLASGRDNDIGDVELGWNTAVRGSISLSGVRADGYQVAAVRLVRPEYAGFAFGQRLADGVWDGEEFVLDQLVPEEAHLQVLVRRGSKSAVFHGPIELQEGRRDLFVEVTLPFDALDASERMPVAALELRALRVPEPAERDGPWLEGRLQSGDGSPLVGWRVHAGFWGSSEPGAMAWTDAEGRFRVRRISFSGERLYCRAPVGAVTVQHAAGGVRPKNRMGSFRQERLRFGDFATNLDLRLPRARRLALRSAGEAAARYAIWTGIRWQEVAADSWLYTPYSTAQPWIRAERPGELPQVLRGRIPGAHESLNPALLRDREVVFPRRRLQPRTLRVTRAGQAARDVPVDVIVPGSYEDPRVDTRVPLVTLVTDREGRIQTRAAPDQAYEVFLSPRDAPPVRAWWGPGEAAVELPAATAEVEVELPPGQRLRLKPAGRSTPVAVLSGGRRTVAAVAPGRHDWVILAAGEPVRGGSVELVAGARVVLHQQPDARSTVELTLPQLPATEDEEEEAGWTVWATRETVAGSARGAVAWSSSGAGFRVREPGARIVAEDGSRMRLAFSGTGTYHIHCWSRSLPGTLRRTVSIEADSSQALEVPRLSAGLRGSLRGYRGGTGFSHHGVAGPRLVLRAAEEDGWDVVVLFPKRREKDGDEFEVAPLPAGRYHLFHHLVGEEVAYWREGKRRSFRGALDAWGGQPVELEADTVTEVGELAAAPLRAVEVEVRDRHGEPLTGASLELRDRMWEAWRQVQTGGSTLAYAEDPIPLPPRWHLRGEPVRVEPVREGLLPWRVVTAEGAVFEGVADVAFDRTVRLDLAASSSTLRTVGPPSKAGTVEPWGPSGWRLEVDLPAPDRPLPDTCESLHWQFQLALRGLAGGEHRPEFTLRQRFTFDRPWTEQEVLPTAVVEFVIDGNSRAFALVPSRRTERDGRDIRWEHQTSLPADALEELASADGVVLAVEGTDGAARREVELSPETLDALAVLADALTD